MIKLAASLTTLLLSIFIFPIFRSFTCQETRTTYPQCDCILLNFYHTFHKLLLKESYQLFHSFFNISRGMLELDDRNSNPLIFSPIMLVLSIIFQYISDTWWYVVTSLMNQFLIFSKISSMKTGKMLMLKLYFYTGKNNVF